LNINNTFAVN